MSQKRQAILWLAGLVLFFAAINVARADDYDDLLAIQDELNAQQKAYNYKRAEELAKEMIKFTDEKFPNQPEILARSANKLALIYNHQQRYAEAETFYKQAIALDIKAYGEWHPQVAQALTNLGNNYSDQGNFAESERLLRRAMQVQERVLGRNHFDVAVTLNNLSGVLLEQGRFIEAESALRRALAIKEEARGVDDVEVARTLYNLGHVCIRQSRYAEARSLLDRAVKIEQRAHPEGSVALAQTINGLASAYLNEGLAAEAEPQFRRALAMIDKLLGPNRYESGFTLHNLAVACKILGRLDEAERLYRRTIEIREQAGPNSPELPPSLTNLALLLKEQGRDAEAVPLLDRALQILKMHGMHSTRHVMALGIRAQIRFKQGRKDEAKKDLQEAMDRTEQLRSMYSGTESERAATAAGLNEVYETMLRWQAEEKSLDAALQTMERSRGRYLIDQINSQGADLLVGLPPEEAEPLRKRDAEAQRRLAMLERKLELATAKSDKLTAEEEAATKSLSAEVEQARQATVDAYRALRNASPAFQLMVAEKFKPVTLDVLTAWVKDQRAILLEYSVGEYGSHLFTISADGEPRLIELMIDEELAKRLGVEPGPLTIKKAAAAMTIAGKDIAQKMAQSAKASKLDPALAGRLADLWKLLVPEELRDSLTAGRHQRLILIPDGALSTVPWETLIVEQGNEPVYFLDRGPPIAVGASATLLYNLQQREPAKDSNAEQPVLSISDPIYTGRAENADRDPLAATTPRARYASTRGALTPLPYTGWETGWLAEQFNSAGLKTGKLMRNSATEAAVRTYVPKRQIVHLACHGLTDQAHGNLFGALALTPGTSASQNPTDDGFLTLAEIYGLDLKGCELAILSACETNLGPQQQGEGAFALSRGFLVAGARRVVASNWLVDDESSASLVSAFCSVLAKQRRAEQPQDYAAALQAAKRWVRKQERWKHPYYWGAFVLTGPN